MRRMVSASASGVCLLIANVVSSVVARGCLTGASRSDSADREDACAEQENAVTHEVQH